MKQRQLRRARMHQALYAYHGTQAYVDFLMSNVVFKLTPEEEAAQKARTDALLESIFTALPVCKVFADAGFIQDVTGYLEEQAYHDTKFRVIRKKDGVEVGQFDTREEAQAAVDKAKTAKKATLLIA